MIESLDKVHEMEWLWLVDHGNQRPHERSGLYLLCCIVRKTENFDSGRLDYRGAGSVASKAHT